MVLPYPSRSVKYLRFQQAEPLKKARKHWGGVIGQTGRCGRALSSKSEQAFSDKGNWTVFRK